jgi:transposase
VVLLNSKTQSQHLRETKVASEPEALVAFFASLGFAVKRIGLEAGPLSAWLHAGLKRAGFDTVLLGLTFNSLNRAFAAWK